MRWGLMLRYKSGVQPGGFDCCWASKAAASEQSIQVPELYLSMLSFRTATNATCSMTACLLNASSRCHFIRSLDTPFPWLDSI